MSQSAKEILTIYPTTITANGDNEINQLGHASVSFARSVLVGINVTAIAGNITFYVESLGADGIWYQLYASAQVTALGQTVVQLKEPLGFELRLRWSVGGTTPSTTFSASMIASYF